MEEAGAERTAALRDKSRGRRPHGPGRPMGKLEIPDQWVRSFTIITTTPNELCAKSTTVCRSSCHRRFGLTIRCGRSYPQEMFMEQRVEEAASGDEAQGPHVPLA
jgi:hypothetical protein